MAIGLCKLTTNERHHLSVIFACLNSIQIATGLVMIILSLYIYFSIAPMLYSERAEINYVFTVIGICGINNTCNYLFGMRMKFKCVQHAHKKSTKTLMFVWTCVSFYILFYLLLLASVTGKVYKHIVRSMKHSFQIGMVHYLQDSLWKITIDKVQFELQCCGVKTYEDWFNANWLNSYRTAGGWAVVPWSCCRLEFPLQCFHDPFQQNSFGTVWADQPSVVLDSVNTGGCIQKMKVPIRSAMVSFIVLVAVNCVVQVLIFLVSRLLYTSHRNLVLLDSDTHGVAPGWIFGRGDFGYARGKTLYEIMKPPEDNIVVVRAEVDVETPQSPSQSQSPSSPEPTPPPRTRKKAKNHKDKAPSKKPKTTKEPKNHTTDRK